MKQYLIGIDIGTSGTKAVLFDTEGEVVASASAEYPMHQPANGLAEENPEDWWNAAAKTLKAVTAKAADGNIAAIGLSGQMHGMVLTDAAGRVTAFVDRPGWGQTVGDMVSTGVYILSGAAVEMLSIREENSSSGRPLASGVASAFAFASSLMTGRSLF